MSAYLILFVTIIAGWFWYDTMKIRERANDVARHSCRKADVQFLDGTVSFAAMKVITTSKGLNLRRVFVFDYSEDGTNRKQGFLIFVGPHVRNVGFQSAGLH